MLKLTFLILSLIQFNFYFSQFYPLTHVNAIETSQNLNVQENSFNYFLERELIRVENIENAYEKSYLTLTFETEVKFYNLLTQLDKNYYLYLNELKKLDINFNDYSNRKYQIEYFDFSEKKDNGQHIQNADIEYLKFMKSSDFNQDKTEEANILDILVTNENNSQNNYNVTDDVSFNEDSLFSISDNIVVNNNDNFNVQDIVSFEIKDTSITVSDIKVSDVTSYNDDVNQFNNKVQSNSSLSYNFKTIIPVTDEQRENMSKGYYIVNEGETLYRVSVNTKVSIEQLKELNNLKSNNIYPGSKLIIK